MNKFLMKWLTAPKSNETRQVQSVQLWYVRWLSRYGEFSGSTEKEVEAFTSEDEANNFAESLRAAFSLIRHRGHETRVSVERGN